MKRLMVQVVIFWAMVAMVQAQPIEFSCTGPTTNTNGSLITDLAFIRFCCGSQCVDIPVPSPTGGDVVSYIDVDNSFAPMGEETQCSFVAFNSIGNWSEPLPHTARLFQPGPPTKGRTKRAP